MPRKPEILEALQDHGLVLGRNLIEVTGWRIRGSENFNPKGSVNHHTAGPKTGVFPSYNTLVFGRPDLDGPLCNAGLDRNLGGRDPRIHLIAAGRANHAGLGGFRGLSGNSSVWGLEVEHSGDPEENISDQQWEMMYIWHAAAMDVSGNTDASLVCQHFEWAPTRKVDFVKQVTKPDAFRAGVFEAMQKEDDDMAAVAPYTFWQFKGTPEVWRVAADGQSKVHIPNANALNVDRFLLGAAGFGTDVHVTGDKADAADSTYEWLLSIPVGGAKHDDALVKAIVDGVIAALPPSSGGGGVTPAEVEAACEKAIKDSGLLGLLPGQ